MSYRVDIPTLSANEVYTLTFEYEGTETIQLIVGDLTLETTDRRVVFTTTSPVNYIESNVNLTNLNMYEGYYESDDFCGEYTQESYIEGRSLVNYKRRVDYDTLTNNANIQETFTDDGYINYKQLGTGATGRGFRGNGFVSGIDQNKNYTIILRVRKNTFPADVFVPFTLSHKDEGVKFDEAVKGSYRGISYDISGGRTGVWKAVVKVKEYNVSLSARYWGSLHSLYVDENSEVTDLTQRTDIVGCEIEYAIEVLQGDYFDIDTGIDEHFEGIGCVKSPKIVSQNEDGTEESIITTPDYLELYELDGIFDKLDLTNGIVTKYIGNNNGNLYLLDTPTIEQLSLNPLKSYYNGSIQTSSQQLTPTLKTTLPISNKFTTTNLTSGSTYNVYFDGTATKLDAGGTVITNPVSPCEVECGGTTLTIEGTDIQNVRVIETTVKNEVGSVCGTTDVELSKVATKCGIHNIFDDYFQGSHNTSWAKDYDCISTRDDTTVKIVGKGSLNYAGYALVESLPFGTYKLHYKVKVSTIGDKYKVALSSNPNGIPQDAYVPVTDVTSTALVEEQTFVFYKKHITNMLFYTYYKGQEIEYYDISLIKLSDEDITGTDTSSINYSQTISKLEQPIKLRSLGTTYDSYNPVTGELIKRIGVSETDGSYSVLSSPIISQVEIDNIPHLYTNGQVKVYSDSDVYPTTILNGQSTNNYEINELNKSNNYTIRYEGECESINLANKSNTQGNNVLVKAGATSGNLTFVNDSGDIDNVLLVQNDVREQEINYFTGLQTVEISRILIENQNRSQYIDLPQPVQLNSLPDGTCDTYNPITGEYVQNVGYLICDDTTTWKMYDKDFYYTDGFDHNEKFIIYHKNLKMKTSTQLWNGNSGFVVGGLNAVRVVGLQSKDEFLEYMKHYPLQIIYGRKEPITTQLTPINIPTFEGGMLQLITTDGKVFPMIEYSMPTNNRYDTSSWETGVVYTQRNMTEAYFNESTTPMTPTETMTLTTDHISSGSIILNDNGNGLIVLKGNYTGRDIPYFTGMRSVEAIEVETTPSPDQPLFGKGGRK